MSTDMSQGQPPWPPMPQHVYDSLPRGLKPLYEHAPPCYLDVEDETSWTYFGHHYAAFLAGDQFPVPAPNQDFPCQFEPAREKRKEIKH